MNVCPQNRQLVLSQAINQLVRRLFAVNKIHGIIVILVRGKVASIFYMVPHWHPFSGMNTYSEIYAFTSKPSLGNMGCFFSSKLWDTFFLFFQSLGRSFLFQNTGHFLPLSEVQDAFGMLCFPPNYGTPLGRLVSLQITERFRNAFFLYKLQDASGTPLFPPNYGTAPKRLFSL